MEQKRRKVKEKVIQVSHRKWINKQTIEPKGRKIKQNLNFKQIEQTH